MRIHVGRAAVAVVIGLTVALAGCSSKGKVREPAKLVDIKHPRIKLSTDWTASSGSGSDDRFTEFRVAYDGSAIYAADIKGRVSAFSADKGHRLWRTKTREEVQAGPVVAGKLVLVGTRGAQLIALHAEDGTEAWKTTLSSEVLAAPAGDASLIVARTVDGQVHGLSPSSGETLWAYSNTVPSLVMRGQSSPLVYGGVAFVGAENGHVVALRAMDGQPVWDQSMVVPSGRNDLERMTDIDGDLVVADAGNCVLMTSLGNETICFDPTNGEARWRRSIRSVENPVVSGDKAYITDTTGVVWCLDLASGAAAWKQEGLLYRGVSAPAVFGGYVVVGDYKGYLHWMDPKTGEFVARSRAGRDPIDNPPEATADHLFVLNDDGKITAVKLPKPIN